MTNKSTMNKDIQQAYEVKTENTHNGWQARSEVILEQTPNGQQVLKLTTAKTRGGISAYVRLVLRRDDGAFVSETCNAFGGFYKSKICSTPCKCVTEKAVRQVHQMALMEMDDFVAEAKAYLANPENDLIT